MTQTRTQCQRKVSQECEQPAATPSFSAMDASMALCAERDEIFFGIVPRVAAKFLMVDFQV